MPGQDATPRSPFLAALWGEDAAPLPSGPRSRSDQEVAALHRRRLIAGMAECLTQQDYASATIADIVARAQVSRRTFYEHFGDREECFLATYDAAAELLMSGIAEAVTAGAGRSWQERINAGIRRYLETLASEPGLTRVFMLDVLSAGPAALRRRDAVLRRFAHLLERLADLHRDELPAGMAIHPDVAYAMVGASDELVRKAIAEDRIAEIPKLHAITERLVHAMLAVGRDGDGDGGADADADADLDPA